MIRYLLKTLFFILISCDCLSQPEFQKILLLEDTFCVLTNVYPTDSCYYFSAISGKQPQRGDFVFGKMSLDGIIVFKNVLETPEFDYYGSLTEIDTNSIGNFVCANYPHIYTFDKNGELLSNILLENFIQDSTHVYCQKMLIDHDNDSYVFLLNYMEINLDNNPPTPNYRNGVCLVRYSLTGDTLWTRRYYSAQSNAGISQFIPLNLMQELDSGYIFTVGDRKVYGADYDPMNTAFTHFYKIDPSGNLLQHYIYFEGANCLGGLTLFPLANGGYIHSYFESKIVNTSGSPKFKYQPVLSTLNSDFHQVRKDALNNEWFYERSNTTSPIELLEIDQNTYVGSYTWVESKWYDSTIWNSVRYDVAVKLFERKIVGDEVWSREYHYIPLIDSINEPDYTLFDLDKTSDGGFILCGFALNFDSANAQVPYQYGYVLKTNCLGFLNPPQASCYHELYEKFKVQFYNMSAMAGTYEWHFGDNSVLWTDENSDTVTHTYSHFGPFQVVLIAHGCNGETDTLRFMVYPSYHLDPSIVTQGQGYMTLFPNPLESGSYLFLYLSGIELSKGNVQVDVYTIDGKLIDEFPISTPEGSYIIENRYSAGMYEVVLRQDKSILQTRKLVIR
jgi:hypothetical protein